MSAPSTAMYLPRFCYVVIETARPGSRVGLVFHNDLGYRPIASGSDYQDNETESLPEVRAFVQRANEVLGVSPEQADAMKWHSMFGSWPSRSTPPSPHSIHDKAFFSILGGEPRAHLEVSRGQGSRRAACGLELAAATTSSTTIGSAILRKRKICRSCVKFSRSASLYELLP